jgi:cobalamin biosynthesis protein CbiD
VREIVKLDIQRRKTKTTTTAAAAAAAAATTTKTKQNKTKKKKKKGRACVAPHLRRCTWQHLQRVLVATKTQKKQHEEGYWK